MRGFAIWMLALLVAAAGAGIGARAEYVGGTVSAFSERVDGRMLTVDAATFQFETKRKTIAIPYRSIHTLEYGQKVDRRYVSAVLLSPLFLLAKSRKHFLTVGYDDGEGATQALIFRVEKSDVRSALAGLEARTGRKVVYQDPEARKAGKG